MNLTINVKDVAGYPTPSAISTTGVSIIIDGTTTSGTDTATKAVTNNSAIEVTVSKSGYYTYSNTITVFNYNMSIDIILVPIITDESDPNYRKPYPYFYSYVKPCSFNVYVVDCSSSPYGEYTYYLNDTTLDSTSSDIIINVGEVGEFDITQQVTVKTILAPYTTLWDIDFTNSIETVEYRPELELEINTASSPETSTTLAVIGEETTVIPRYTMNNTLGVSCTEGSIEYKLYDIDGDQVGITTTYAINLASLPNPEDIAFTFTPTEKGDYSLITTLTNCCTSTEVTTTIPSASFIEILSNGHEHTIRNLSTDTSMIITLYDYTGSIALETDIYPISMSAGGSYKMTFSEDGVYIVKISSGDNQYVFIIADYSDLRSCFETLIKKVACKETDSCCDGCRDNDKFILNKLIALGTTYFSYLQGLYGFNNIYEALSSTEIQELYNIKYIKDMMDKYCNCNVAANLDGGGCSSC